LPFGPGLAVTGGFFADGVEADFAARLGRSRHESTDGVEERLDAFVVTFEAAFEFGEFAGQGVIRCLHPAQAAERAHDGDVDLHGALAAQHAGKHGHALFGEGVGKSAPEATPP